jgi:hypothetical protein
MAIAVIQLIPDENLRPYLSVGVANDVASAVKFS